MSFRLTLCAALLLGAATAQAAPADVAGIQIGMTLEAARAQAKKINPAYQLENVHGNGFAARGPSDLGIGTDDLLVLATKEGKVWQVVRHQGYPEGQRFTLDTLKKSLAEKYGPHSSYNDRRGRVLVWIWEFDASGKQYKSPSGTPRYESPCNGLNEGQLADHGSLKSIYMRVTQGPFPENCSYRIISKVMLSTDKMVQGLVIQMVDSATMGAQARRAIAKIEAERQKARDAEKAANHKPNL